MLYSLSLSLSLLKRKSSLKTGEPHSVICFLMKSPYCQFFDKNGSLTNEECSLSLLSVSHICLISLTFFILFWEMFSLYLRFFVMTSQEYISVGIKKSVILLKLTDSILEKVTSTYFVFWSGTDGLLLVLYQFVTEERERERKSGGFLE